MKDVVAITGVKQPTLQQWLRDSFIIPSTKAEGTGSRNLFDFSNLCEILLFKKLIDNGISRELASYQIKVMPPMSLFEDVPSDSIFIVTYLNLSSGKVGSAWHSTENIKENPHTVTNLLDDQIKEWVSKGFDIISLYSLNKIIEDVKKGIALLNKS